jgi:hypothetical protein
MGKNGQQSPLLGYNTNVRHDGILFHIQTEDSGVGHPHIITHLFIDGTILATKKTSYEHLLDQGDVEDGIRQLMKDQHKAMFIELRDGVHDEATSKLNGKPAGDSESDQEEPLTFESEAPKELKPAEKKAPENERVRVVRPAVMIDPASIPDPKKEKVDSKFSGRSIFDTPNSDGDFGEALLTDKSLDEVILSYLTDDEDE